MKYVFYIFLFITVAAHAQPTSVVETFTTIGGQPFFPKQYTDINGSPYLFDDWTTSTIELNDGKVINNIKTNFNVVNSELLYMDEKNNIMVARPSVIKSIAAGPRKFITTPAKNSYFEIVSSEGKATLVRHTKKVVMETKAFNSATIQKDFRTSESHLVLVNGNLTEVKSANDLFDALSTSDKLKEFAKKEKLRQKSVDSWVKIVDYYNSI